LKKIKRALEIIRKFEEECGTDKTYMVPPGTSILKLENYEIKSKKDLEIEKLKRKCEK
jgi:hypothetical protein